jgi:hypothetical protein
MLETKFVPLIKSEIQDAISKQSHGALSPVSSSNADHGQAILTALRDKGAFLEVGAVEGDSVLPEAMVKRAQEMNQSNTHERVLVNLYTPALRRVVQDIDSNIRLINSEEYRWRWLQASSVQWGLEKV